MVEIKINQEPIELSKILKLANIVSGGGEAKVLISEGLVCVNGDIESRKRKKIYVNDPLEKNVFTKEISFNLIPHIDVFLDDGFTKEEVKMRDETKKILDENIDVVAHCVRVPVFVGHSEAVFIECENPMDEEVAREVLTEMEGVIVIDHRADEGYITPKEAAGEDGVYISRIRRDESVPSGLVFWCVSDNLRKGAALNAVQIAELAISQGIK